MDLMIEVSPDVHKFLASYLPAPPLCRYMGSLGSQVMCDNIPGLMNKQRQLCRQHPKVMQAIGAGMKDWISECQHQFRNHRWNCNTTARDHNLFGRLLLRSE